MSARYLGVLEADFTADTLRGLRQSADPLAVTAVASPPAILSFNPAEVGVAAGSAQQVTASFSVSGYTGSFTPTATLHYGHDYTAGSVRCTPTGASETCNVPVTFHPSLPGARKDAIFLMDGSTRLATVLLNGVGQGPLSLVQPGAFTTSVPTNNDLYQSVADEDGVVYILPSGNSTYVEKVTKAGVASQIVLNNPPYFWTIGIDGAGVLYLFNESTTVTTYDTVQGIQGTYQIPSEPQGVDATDDWYPGAVGVDGSVYIVNQIRNNGVAYALRPDGSTAYGITFNPGVLQPSTATVDSAGNFFVGGYEINEITPAGVQTQINTVGASEGLAVDAADTLYATRYSPTHGVAELPASNYSTPIASFGSSSPLGMSLGSDGTLYISNYVNLDIFDRFTTETVDFGEVNAGSSQTNSTASIYNGGNQPLSISGYTLSTLSDSGFSLDFSSANACMSGIVLAPGALCQVGVVFAPTHPGSFSGTITISSNSLNGTNTTQTIQLAGTTYGSYDVLSPSPLVFAAQAPGTSKTLAVTMTNQGNSYPSTVYSVTTNNPAFTITQGTCSGVAVQVGASCKLQVTFTPTAMQVFTGTATVVTYVAGTAQASQTITLPLRGSVTGPVVAKPVIAPGPGSYTSTQQVTITDSTPGATIYYSTDGSSPSSGSASSTKYTGAISVSSNETLQAIATATGYLQSSIASATYTFHEAVASVTPTSLAFGKQVEGIASIAQTVTLMNTGAGALQLNGFSITGSTDFSQTNNCAASLTAGSSCTLSIVYTPASLGAKTARLTVKSDTIEAPPAVTLTGTGIAPPAATLSPASLNFGNRQEGSASTAMILTLSNPNSTTVLNFDSISISGAGAASFSQTNNCGATIAADGNCSISVTFTPAGIGAFSASLAIVTRYPGFAPVSISSALSGTGVTPRAPTFTPSTLAFGNQIVMTTSAGLSTTLTNTGTDTLVLDEALPTILGSGASSISATSNCPATLAPAAACTVSASFTPSGLGAYSLSLQMMAHYSGASSIEFKPAAALTGTGIAQPPVLAFTPASLNFGSQFEGSSTPLKFTVTNISTTDTIVVGDVFTASSGVFNAYSPQCANALPPGKSCTVTAAFNPTGIQAYSGTISFAPQVSACGGCTRNYPVQTIAVRGAGIAQPPVLTFSPASLSFGNQLLDTTSAAQSVTVTNISKTDTVQLTNLGVTGTGFLPQPWTCSSVLGPGASCTIAYEFNPSALQTYSAIVAIQVQPQGCVACTSYYPNQTFKLTGTGTGSGAVLAISPATLAFGNQIENTSSAAKSVTVTNISKTDTVVASSLGLINPGFLLQPTACTSPLAPGANCTLSFVFSPVATEAYNATFTINLVQTACGGCVQSYPPQGFDITGTGVAQPPVLAISPSILNFGNQIVNTTSARLPVTVKNTSATDAIALTTFVIDSPGFSVNFSSCPPPLAPGASCTVYYTFSPSATQVYDAVATMQAVPFQCGGCVRDYPLGTFKLTGTGIAQPPVLAISPATLNFGNQIVGTISTQLPVTVTNTSATDTVALTTFVINSPGFSVNFSSCPSPLAPGASCTVFYAFNPDAPQVYNAVASIQAVPYQCGGCVRDYPLGTFKLSGTGVTPRASLTPASMSFTSTVGATSAAQTAALTNTGVVPLTILGVSVSGASPTDYSQTNNCGNLLAVGAKCTISITFTPAFPGSYPATLAVSDNDPTSPQTISMAGSSTSTPDFVLAPSTP